MQHSQGSVKYEHKQTKANKQIKQTNKQTNKQRKNSSVTYNRLQLVLLLLHVYTSFLSVPSHSVCFLKPPPVFLFHLCLDLFMFPPQPPQESEEPFYRIASLEGQLRQCQDKLREIQLHHERVLAAERAAEEEKWAVVTQQLMVELDGTKSELTLLKDAKKMATEEKSEEESVAPPKLTLSKAEPEMPARSKGSKKKGKNPNRLMEEDSQRKGSLGSALVSPLLKHSRTRSASQDALESLGLEIPDVGEKPRLSLEGERPNGRHRPSISQLIEESMRNPQSMATIRKELKSDGFTPKIQKKFRNGQATTANPQPQSTPPPLKTLKPAARDS